MADFDFSTLVTDRSASDLELLRDLLSTPMGDWTAEQLAAFNQAISKGAYNYTDLNRVTACMEYLDETLRSYGYRTGYQRIVVHPEEPPGPVGPLPEGYTELEYIQSSGTQYIDTGFKQNQNSRIVMSAQVTQQPSTHAWLFEGRISNGSGGKSVFLLDGAVWNADYNGSARREAFPDIGIFDALSIDFDKNSLQINEDSFTWTTSTFQSTANLALLACNTAGAISGYISAKLYNCQIYDNGALVRDFVPCRDPTGNVGLYDLVGAKFYGNAGSGTFTAGPPVNPKLPDGYKRLKYIQANGTQFVDTGFKPNQNTAVYMHAKMVEASSYPSLFGARNNTSQMYWLYHNNGNSTPSDAFIVRVNATSHNVSAPFGDEQLFFITNDQGGVGDDTVSFDSGTFQSSYNMYLFGVNNKNALQYPADMELMDCMIYDGDTFIRNYVPCETPDGDIGLYDLVTNEFYGNTGTGAFIAGPEVPQPEPEPTLDPYTWYEGDIPTASQMAQYLSNVLSIWNTIMEDPTLPETMDNLTQEEANKIEAALIEVNTAIEQIVAGMARSNSFTFWSGNRPFPTAYSNRGRNWAELDAMNTEWKNWQVATWYLLLYGNLEAEGVVS